MGNLINLAVWIMAESGRAGGVRAAAIRISVAALCAGLAGVLLLAALGCAAAALWNSILPSLGAVGAPLVVAAALSTATIIPVAAAWLTMRYRRHRSSAGMATRLLSEAERLFNEHKGAVLLAAVVAGMAAESGGRRS